MKKIFNVMMLVIAMTMFTVNSFAQAHNNKQRLTREAAVFHRKNGQPAQG